MKVEEVDIQTWNSHLEQCSTATFFHTPDWYELWAKYQGQQYQIFKFTFPSGNTALLPLAREKKHRNLFTYFVSSPAGTYGGPISQTPLEAQDIQVVEKFLSTYKYITIRNNPLQPVSSKLFNIAEQTQVLDLRPGWDAIFKKWSKGHSSAAKKSIRDGINFRPAKLEEWKLYYEIYKKTLDRWEHPPAKPYLWELFLNIQQIDSNKCTLWLALREDKPIAGALCFYFQNHAVYWHGASLEAYRENKPVHGLQMHIIKNAIEKGYHWYDFNPSGGHKGVIHFKKGFGAEYVSADVYSRTPRILRMLIK